MCLSIRAQPPLFSRQTSLLLSGLSPYQRIFCIPYAVWAVLKLSSRAVLTLCRFEMHGILGMDFLIQAGAIINLHEMTITFAN